MEDVLGAFGMLKKACLEAPVLSFADFNKLLLQETDVSKLGLGPVLSHELSVVAEADDSQYHPVAYTSQSITVPECNYH